MSCARLVFLVQLWRFRSCSSSQVVDYLFVPQRQLSMVPPCRKTIDFAVAVHGYRRPCCSGRAGYFPVVAQWPFYGPDCSSDLFLPQLQYTMADVPVVQVVQVHFPSVRRVAEHGGRCPCCASRAISLPCRDAEADSHVHACLATIEVSQLQYRAGWSMSLLCRSSWVSWCEGDSRDLTAAPWLELG